MVFNATFNNISAISWQSVLLVEENVVPGENYWPAASTLSHNVVSRTYRHEWGYVILIQQNSCMNVKLCCHFELKQIHTCFYCLLTYICLLDFHWFLSLIFFQSLHFYCLYYIFSLKYWRENYESGLIFFFYFQFDTIFVWDSSMLIHV